MDIIEGKRFGLKFSEVSKGIVFDKFIENTQMARLNKSLFEMRAAVRKENPTLGNACKLVLNSLYGKTISKEIEEEFVITTQQQFEEKFFDYKVRDYWYLPNGQCVFKKESDDFYGLFPQQLGIQILSQSKKIMNDVALDLRADKENVIHYTDTDSYYLEMKHLDRLKDSKSVLGKPLLALEDKDDDLGCFKNDFGEGKMGVEAIYVGPKQKYIRVENVETKESGEKFSWKGVRSSLLKRDHYLNLLKPERERLIGEDCFVSQN